MFELMTFELTILERMVLGAIELAYNTESAVELPYAAYLIDIIG